VSSILDIFYNLDVVNHLQIIGIQSLAAYVAYANKNVLALFRMRNSANKLGLAIRERHILLLSHVVKSDAAHRTAVAYVPTWEVYTGDGVCKSCLYQTLKCKSCWR